MRKRKTNKTKKLGTNKNHREPNKKAKKKNVQMLLEASDAGAKGEMAWAGTSNREDISRVGARSMGMPFSSWH